MTIAETLGKANTKAGSGARYRAIHHLALTTDDMKETVDFYVDVLGMPLVHAMEVPEGRDNWGNPPWQRLRHYFFDMGGDALLAFFEIPKGARGPSDRDAIGGMQHVAFATTADHFDDIQQRLAGHGVTFAGPNEIFPSVFSIYFFDPSGVRLEVCCQTDDGPELEVIEAFTQTRDEACAELESLCDDPAWVEKRLAAFKPSGAGHHNVKN